MTRAELVRIELHSVETNKDYSEAILRFRDNSWLYFCHRVGERWVKAVGPSSREDETGVAGELVASITKFRLNAKHLDIQFADDSRWDEPLQKFRHPEQ